MGTTDEAVQAGLEGEEVCARLWAPYAREPLPAALQTALGNARVRAFEGIEGLGSALSAEEGMDALRVAVHGDR